MRLSTHTVIAMLRAPRDNDTLGGRIWRARDAAGLSVKDLAGRMGVRPESVSAWERDRAEPRANRLALLATVLNVSKGWLTSGIGTAPADGLSQPLSRHLRDQLAQIKALHEQTGKAIGALEMELDSVIKNIQQDEM